MFCTTVLLFVSDPPPRTIDEFSAGEFRELFELHVIGHFLTSKVLHFISANYGLPLSLFLNVSALQTLLTVLFVLNKAFCVLRGKVRLANNIHSGIHV